MSKFQQQQQRRMAGKAWMDQQRRERERIQQMSPPAYRTNNKFAAVEDEASRLRQELDAGRLTAPEFDDKLKELMVQDHKGTWWMVGSLTGGWYRYDGVRWIPDTPPTQSVSPASMGGTMSSAGPSRGVFARLISVSVILAVGLASSGFLFVVVGNITDAIIPGFFPFVTATIAGLIGLGLTLRAVRNAWNS